MSEKRNRPDRRQGPRRKTLLVENWKCAWRWLSVQVSAALASLALVYEMVPAMKDYIPTTWFNAMMAAGAIGVILGRLKKQGPVRGA